MHLLAWLGLIFGLAAIIAIAVAVVATLDRRRMPGRADRSPRRTWLIAAAAGGVSLAIGASLVYAQRPLCGVLGGEWIEPTQACRNEIGGNGINDVGNEWAPYSP